MTLSFAVFKVPIILLLTVQAFQALKVQHLVLQLFTFRAKVHFKFENELILTSIYFLPFQNKQKLIFIFVNLTKVTISFAYVQIINRAKQQRNHL